LLLTDAVFDPVEVHVDGFGPFLFDGVVGKSRGGGIVGLRWRGWLWMASFSKGDAYGEGFLSVEEQGTNFGFSSGG
jgi:hypothetical protein